MGDRSRDDPVGVRLLDTTYLFAYLGFLDNVNGLPIEQQTKNKQANQKC
jgi:hypothetical protein